MVLCRNRRENEEGGNVWDVYMSRSKTRITLL